MKSYTDLEQSRKLAEILPFESADMWWLYVSSQGKHIAMMYEEPDPHYIARMEGCGIKDTTIPCWSLSALLNILPKKYYPIKDHGTYLTLSKPKDKWCVLYWDATGMQDGEQALEDNPIDACYEMIIKLHELKML